MFRLFSASFFVLGSLVSLSVLAADTSAMAEKTSPATEESHCLQSVTVSEKIGTYYLQRRQADSALHFLLAILPYHEARGDAGSLGFLCLHIGEAYWLEGNSGRASHFLQKSERLALEGKDGAMVGRAKLRLARLEDDLGLHHSAERDLLIALDLLHLNKDSLEELLCLEALQEYYEKQGNDASAALFEERLSALRAEIGTRDQPPAHFPFPEETVLRPAREETAMVTAKTRTDFMEIERPHRPRHIALIAIAVLLFTAIGLFLQWRQVLQSSRLFEVQNEELKRINKELEELIGTKDKLLSIIGHDLKNPINSISGFNKILRDSHDQLPEETREKYRGYIDESLATVSGLLNDLLDWARIQRKEMMFNQERIDLRVLIQKNVELFYTVAVVKGISLETEIEETVLVYGDDHMVNTILRNLLSNALKFTHAGGSILIRSREKAGRVVVELVDTGIGMEPEVLTKLFLCNGGYTREGTEGEKGTGLGLMICKEFIEQHRGTMRVSSEPGKGSTFAFDLPAFKEGG